MKRSLTTLCPSCGAQVRFSSGDSVLAVCGYCASTLLRKDDSVENLGRMAEVFEDHSPLQLGVQGRFDERAFGLIGRLQYRYPAGVWNEWRLLFDDGSTGWLSEDNGQYVLLDDGADPADVASPAWDDLRIDQPIDRAGVGYRVVGKESASVIAGQGELPFVVGAGYPVRVADLRGPGGQFATLDYPVPDEPEAAGPPRFYAGRAVTLAELKPSGLRSELDRTVATVPFQCPSCGAPVQATLAASRTITCANCASVIDLSQGVGQRMEHYLQAKPRPLLLALQSVGRLGDVAWTVVGYQRRGGQADGESFAWDEYLLHEPTRGFRFLVHDDGHWTFMEVLQRSVKRAHQSHDRGFVHFEGKRFDLYSAYQSSVSYVAGEFYWQVKQGDTTRNQDYIAPPLALSCEETDNEITWSRGEYLDSAAVTKAFGLKSPLPRATSLGMIQPAPPSWRPAYLKLALTVMAVLVLIQGWLLISGGSGVLVASSPLPFDAAGREHLIQVAGSRPANLVIRTDARLSNQAITVNVDLASRAPVGGGAAPAAGVLPAISAQNLQLEASREVGFWEGQDSDGYWSEGSRSERIVFKVPPGPYLVRVGGQFDGTAGFGSGASAASAAPPTAVYRIEQSSRPTWLPFLTGLLVLAVLNLIAIFTTPDPEAERWAESDFGTLPGRPSSN